MTKPVIGILALQGDVREHATALDLCGATPRLVRRPGELDGLAGLIVPGGESTTIDKLSRAFELRDPLITALRGGLPTFGSCAGMIMLADHIVDAPPDQQTFGGIDITVRRNAFGRQVDSFEVELDLPWLGGGPFPAVFIRAPWVEDAAAAVQILGVAPGPHGERDRIVAVRQGDLIATSFHPEVSGDRRLHQFFVDLARAA